MPSPRRLRAFAIGATGLSVVAVVAGVTATAALRHADTSSDRAAATTLARPVNARADRARRTIDVVRAVRPVTPDAIVLLSRSARPRAVQRLQHVSGVRSVAVLSRGVVRMHGARVDVVGGDLVSIRRFTPELTARVQPLWDSLARGEITVSYSAAKAFRHDLGATFVAHARNRMKLPLRIGAFASLGIGHAEGLVDATTAMMLDLHRDTEIVVAAHHLDMDTIRAKVTRIFGAHAKVMSLRPKPVDQAVMSDYARATIPSAYLALYRAAAQTCPGLPWTVLAAIGAVETGHGANTHVSSKGAMGPMQFLPSTFATYGFDADGDGVANILDPNDAVFSAARYLCLWGAGRGGQALYDAVFAYNHADWYVREVFTLANAYA